MANSKPNTFFNDYSLNIEEVSLSNGNIVFVQDISGEFTSEMAKNARAAEKKAKKKGMKFEQDPIEEMAKIFCNCLVDSKGVKVFSKGENIEIMAKVSLADLKTVSDAAIGVKQELDEDLGND